MKKKKFIAGARAVIALAFASSGVAHADTTTLPGAGYLAYLANTGQLQALLPVLPQAQVVVKTPQTLPAPQDLIAPAAAGFVPPVITSVQLPAVPLPVALPPVPLPLPVQLPAAQQFIPPVFQAFIPPVVSSYLP